MLRAPSIFIVLILLVKIQFATAKADTPTILGDATLFSRFECGGEVETQVWNAWDQNIRRYLEQHLLHTRLLMNGDVFALYDLQTYAHNMVSMAQRCKRAGRILEMAGLIEKAYQALTPGSLFSPGRRWICRGGSSCNNKNGLLNGEVVLSSAQFLGLASSVANAMATSHRPLNKEEIRFIRETVDIITEHFLRWGNSIAILKLHIMAKAGPEAMVGSSSVLFFTDKLLWMIAVYAELSGILASEDRHATIINDRSVASMRKHLNALLELFSARISVLRIPDSRIGDVAVADIDRGYWNRYPDNRYAGYSEEEKPVSCLSSEKSPPGAKLKYHVLPASFPRRHDIGWDFSHARRLVHALDSVERNRKAMQSVFSLPDERLPPHDLPLAFANNLVAVIWNGDMVKPLFSNYWSGVNGWYRVAYDNNGAGECNEGSPPYGLSDSFMTGGYIIWSRYRKEIGLLGKRFHMLVNHPDSEDRAFIEKYYSRLSSGADEQIRVLMKFMFLPTLVGVDIN